MNEVIIVLGGDGYYGWPIALKLAVTRPTTKILIADNEWRRNTVRRIGSDSLIPIARHAERLAAYREVYGQDNLHFINMDINSDALEELIKKERPHTIYHMAQQCSAPYSMLGLEESLYTINNNEGNNMRLLWAVRKHVPDAHIVKMGSMGEYANGGIDIAEGYFYPEFNGKKAVLPLPFPRQSDDVYHISKINDSNYLSMACRKWGLRITEVMQSTLFGVYTDEMAGNEALYTRFDYDDIFGTVVNRFLTQAVAGHPLTVYGKGNQSTGIMPMKDAVNSLETIAGAIPERGEHKVVNHVTKANCSINEIAQTVKHLAEQIGYEVKIDNVFDPRSESEAQKFDIKVMTEHIDNNVATTAIEEVLNETLGIINKYKSRIHTDVFTHHIHAFKGQYTEQEASADTDSKSEQHWKQFREQNFKSDRINLNPGTLGTVSTPVKNVRKNTYSTYILEGNPIGMYEHGRQKIDDIKNICRELWPSSGYKLMVGNGTSQTVNLLALSMLRAFNKDQSGPYRVITSTHEHPGGIGVFEQLPEYEVHYLSDEVLANERKLRAAIKRIKPSVAFISHVYYDTGNMSPQHNLCSVAKKAAPGCKVILDVTQSIGLYDPPFGIADAIVGSLHKWMFGPHGSGLTWMKADFHEWIGGVFWNGHGLSSDTQMCNFSLQGGQDFIMYAEIYEALKLYKKTGKDTILQRSGYLSSIFRDKLEETFSANGINYKILNTTIAAPLLSIALTDYNPFDLYSALNAIGIHCKCMVDHKHAGGTHHILRFGMPYYETVDRLEQVITALQKQIKVTKLTTITEPAITSNEAAAA
ncbi:MAG: NAD-dependent epimerase/dehydratase family protein [Sphingobacteriales bacterium]|nr:MAG: NAD-dependent epimerase/dehydratase family protein [Sphingobacteriales bacterium]